MIHCPVFTLCGAACRLLQAGTGVHVYVLDTGIRATHTEFADAATQRSRVAEGFDAVYSSNSTEDCHGHGTHVAAIIGGEFKHRSSCH